jgi:hypothetical protein
VVCSLVSTSSDVSSYAKFIIAQRVQSEGKGLHKSEVILRSLSKVMQAILMMNLNRLVGD